MADVVQQYHPHDLRLSAGAIASGAGGADPFLVEVRAVLEGPDGRRTAVPGFYDGDGTWVVRVCPNERGTWRYTLESAVPALAGQRGELRCVASQNPRVHGALRVDPLHRHHFVYEDGERPFVLGYEANWLWALGFLDQGEARLRRFVEQIAGFGFNHVFVNAYAHDTRWRPGTTQPEDYGPPPAYAWEGTNEAPDHLHPNVAYWRVFDAMVRALFDAGVTAHLYLRVYNKGVAWPANRSLADDLYFRYVVARYQGFSNVVWDFAKESKNEPDKAYLENRLSLVKAQDGYRRLVTTHDDDVFYYDPRYAGACDFVTDQNHRDLASTLLAQRSAFACPVLNEEFAYECGPGGLEDRTYTRSHTPEEHALRSWEVVSGGGYPGYYYAYTAWDVLRPEDEPPGYALHQRLADFMREGEWWALAPYPGIAPSNTARGARCLANPGAEYLVFCEAGGNATVTLPGAGERAQGMRCDWLQPLTGERARTTETLGPRAQLRPPWGPGTPFVVRLRPADDGAGRAWPASG
jgi:hypothetical protein